MGPGVCFGGFGEEFDAGLGFVNGKAGLFVDSFDFGLISLLCCSGFFFTLPSQITVCNKQPFERHIFVLNFFQS